jgi:hypothetical protein
MSVQASPVRESLLTCTVLLLLVRMTADRCGRPQTDRKIEGYIKEKQTKAITTYHSPSQQQLHTPYPTA